MNRSRTEARCLIPFDTTAPKVAFPFVEQAARLTRCFDSGRHPALGIETEYLITSRARLDFPGLSLLQADRAYWGIETGLHLRLGVSAGEDRSRVRHRTSVLNLAMMRRAVVSVAVYWIRQRPKKRWATMSGFYDYMSAHQSNRAFSLVTARHSSSLAVS